MSQFFLFFLFFFVSIWKNNSNFACDVTPSLLKIQECIFVFAATSTIDLVNLILATVMFSLVVVANGAETWMLDISCCSERVDDIELRVMMVYSDGSAMTFNPE